VRYMPKAFRLAILAAGSLLLTETNGWAYVSCGSSCAVEWSGDSIINLGGLPGSEALGINNSGQVVGYSGGPRIFEVGQIDAAGRYTAFAPSLGPP
jgi:hypothetical protein